MKACVKLFYPGPHGKSFYGVKVRKSQFGEFAAESAGNRPDALGNDDVALRRDNCTQKWPMASKTEKKAGGRPANKAWEPFDRSGPSLHPITTCKYCHTELNFRSSSTLESHITGYREAPEGVKGHIRVEANAKEGKRQREAADPQPVKKKRGLANSSLDDHFDRRVITK